MTQVLSLIVFDNSPHSQAVELGIDCPVLYKHDSSNPGLAAAYNFALNVAHDRQCDWLLLLDQDTSLTDAFMTELMECTAALIGQPLVASIVPKLVVDGTIRSPAAHFIDQIRHQYKYRQRGPGWRENISGIQRGRLSAFNSGATLRVSALQSIGGFPSEFWLDYLDHAVFDAFSKRGYEMYVMQALLRHDSSQINVSETPVWRQQNVLSAQALFVTRTATFWDRLLYRVWLLRYSRSLWLEHTDKEVYRKALIQAFNWRWTPARIHSPESPSSAKKSPRNGQGKV